MAAAIAGTGGTSGSGATSSYVAPASRSGSGGGGGSDTASQVAALEKQVAAIQKEMVALGNDPKTAQLRQELSEQIQAIEAEIVRLEQKAAEKNRPVDIPNPSTSGNQQSARSLIGKALGIGSMIDTEA
jgi:uncharacterized protein HemX